MPPFSIRPPQFEILSDLHLETPLTRPRYANFDITTSADYLCLIGDIGLAKDDGLFTFLARTLEQNGGLKIIFVIGNHESYQMTHRATIRKFQDFAAENPRFVLLHRTRLDVDENTTVLGCTLWTHVPDEHAHEVATRLTDFHETRGIRDWDLATHIAEHKLDAEWLDTQVATIGREEPHRHIIVLTHHSPTRDARANDPRFPDTGRPLGSGFRTDLSLRPCWTSPKVKVWAFGHTHYSCAFEDEATSRLVVANQKGYGKLMPTTTPTADTTTGASSMSHVVVEATPGDGKWKLLLEEKKEWTQLANNHEAAAKNVTPAPTKAKGTGKVQFGRKSWNIFSRLSKSKHALHS